MQVFYIIIIFFMIKFDKKLKLILIILLLVSFVWVSSYFIFNWNLTKIINFLPELSELKKSNAINYTFDTKIDFKNNDFTWAIEFKNWQIITQDSWLKQRLSIEEIKVKSPLVSATNSLKNFDLITDKFNTYFFASDSNFVLGTNTTGSFYSSIDNKYSSILKTWKYIKIDNSKPIINALWEKLSKDELFKDLIIWLSTSNPIAYYKESKTYEDLINYLKTDKILDVFLKNNIYDEKSKKTSLLINENLCQLSPFINNISKEFMPSFISIEEDNCKKIIWDINTKIWLLNFYKEWDLKAGNFKLILQQWVQLNIKIEYKDHKLDNWNIYLADPSAKELVIDISWDIKWIKKSLIKVDYSLEKTISIKWEIKDWNGDIILKSLDEKVKLDAKIKLSKYNLDNYDIVLSALWSTRKLDVFAKWNLETWKIDITYNEDIKSKDNINFKLDYKKWEYDLIFNSYANSYKSKLSKDYFNFYVVLDWYYNASFEYNKSKIIWSIFINNNTWTKTNSSNLTKILDLTWNYKNIWEFDLLFNITWLHSIETPLDKITIKANKTWDRYNYNLNWSLKDKELLKLSTYIENIKDKFNMNISLLASLGEKIDFVLNIEHKYDKWKAVYKLPEKFQEIEISIKDIIIFPNIENINSKMKDLFFVGVIWWTVWVLWTSYYIQNMLYQWYWNIDPSISSWYEADKYQDEEKNSDNSMIDSEKISTDKTLDINNTNNY